MKLSFLTNVTHFQMFILVSGAFVLTTGIFSILKHDFLAMKYNQKIILLKSIRATVDKCDLLIDTWTYRSKHADASVDYPNFRPVYHVSYSFAGKKYLGEVTTPHDNGFHEFREAHKALCKIIGTDSVNVTSVDNSDYLWDDILYIVNNEYVASFPKEPTYSIMVKIDPNNPETVNLGHTKEYYTVGIVILTIFLITFFFLILFAPNYSNMYKTIVSILIILTSFPAGMFLVKLLDILPKATTKYSFTIGSTIDINCIKDYISENHKDALDSTHPGLLKD